MLTIVNTSTLHFFAPYKPERFNHACRFCQSLVALPLLPNTHSLFPPFFPYLTSPHQAVGLRDKEGYALFEAKGKFVQYLYPGKSFRCFCSVFVFVFVIALCVTLSHIYLHYTDTHTQTSVCSISLLSGTAAPAAKARRRRSFSR
jgi:hypothetical protein